MKSSDRNLCPALVFTPAGRDASVALALLREARAEAIVCPDLVQFSARLGDEISCAVVTEEALRGADLRGITAWVATQPAWSDFPFIVLTQRRGTPDGDMRLAELSTMLGNVTFLERPFHPTTFISVVGTALRGRFRQFEARSRIEELHEGEARLHTALTAGQLGSWELDLSTSGLITSATCKAVFGRVPNADFSSGQLVASVHPDDRDRMQGAMGESYETGCDFAYDNGPGRERANRTARGSV